MPSTSDGWFVSPPYFVKRACAHYRICAGRKNSLGNDETSGSTVSKYDAHIVDHEIVCPKCGSVDQFKMTSKSHLRIAKSIGDASWSAFIAMLVYKGDWYGCRVEKVNHWYPS